MSITPQPLVLNPLKDMMQVDEIDYTADFDNLYSGMNDFDKFFNTERIGFKFKFFMVYIIIIIINFVIRIVCYYCYYDCHCPQYEFCFFPNYYLIKINYFLLICYCY